MKRGPLAKIFPCILTVIAGALGVSVLAPSAQADSVLYILGTPNSFLTGTGPYATVSVDRTSTTTATITFSSLNNGGFEYLMGGSDAVAVNVNSTNWSIGNLSSSNSFSGFIPPTLTDNGANFVASFGSFNQTVSATADFQRASTSISFDLNDNTGSWAGAASVLTPNASGFIAAIHAFECANTCTEADGATVTGFAVDGLITDGGPSATPLPAALPLFASGLATLGFLGWRRKRKGAALAA
jgi:hypothetical protein